MSSSGWSGWVPFRRGAGGGAAGAHTIFSAHGVSKAVEADAAERGLAVLDATCPLVAKVHIEGKRYVRQGRQLILIGHAGHPEVEGTRGQIDGPVYLVQNVGDVATLAIADDTPLAFVTQTTLSVDDTRAIIAALRRRFTDWWVPTPRTSATPPRTGRRRCASSASSPM
jgi:4-hydroxy-3-methylbut-2-enyl diphosphate reductase